MHLLSDLLDEIRVGSSQVLVLDLDVIQIAVLHCFLMPVVWGSALLREKSSQGQIPIESSISATLRGSLPFATGGDEIAMALGI